MGGFFAATLKNDCVFDLFFGTDYHSHLGTRRAGMTVLGENGFERAIHNIENSPFRSKFDRDVQRKLRDRLYIRLRTSATDSEVSPWNFFSRNCR